MFEEVRYCIEIHQRLLEWMFVISLATLVAGVLLGIAGIIFLPRDYFSSRYKPFSRKISNPFIRRTYIAVKNVTGVLFILMGLAMLLLPGQGLLTIAIGLSLTDFPGKHKMVGHLLRRGPVLRGANWLRIKAGKLPLDPFEDR